jgi:choline-glycine betaine transporter
VQVSTVALRGASTALTGGLASVFLSTGEWFGALAVAIMAIVAPVVALLLVVFVALVAWVSVRRRRSRAGLSKSREVSPQSVP